MESKIQGSDETIYAVDLARQTCSCRKKSCEHLVVATDVFINHGRRHRFPIMSASHKTARTSSIKLAWPWAETFAAISGWEKVATYFGKAIFEDSRNLKLWAQIRNQELTPRDQVRAFILSRKKWESPTGMSQHMHHWVSAHSTYQFNKRSWNEAKLRRKIRKFSSIEDGYEAWFYIKQKKQFRPVFWDELAARGEREKNDRLKWFLRHQPSTGYDCMVGLEVALNVLDESVSELHPDHTKVEKFVPAFREEYEDVHSYAGRRRFIHWFPELVRNSLPGDSKLRLQLSGQIWGCAYRFAAFNQRGTIMGSNGQILAWNDVRLEQNATEIAWLDSMFYSTCYKALERKEYWTAPPGIL